jgi:anaerobic magnesium-protoporphyrin IX monomethyl ester cyclase
MSRITFVYPDFESLGVEYLMAVCADAGHDVQLAYYEAEDMYLGRVRKRVSYDKLLDTIERTDPQVVAFSCVTDNFRYQLRCAELLKQKRGDIFTIFGGVHPTAVPQETLAHRCVDAVAIGETEDSLIELLAQTTPGGQLRPTRPVPGIVFKSDGRLMGEFREGDLPNLDTLPLPGKEAFLPHLGDMTHEYRIITSRGCPYRCSYCFNSHLYRLRGRTLLRRRSVSNVIWELRHAKQKFGIKRVVFVDDSFTTQRKWVVEFCEQYKREIDLPFACLANPAYLSDEIARSLAAAPYTRLRPLDRFRFPSGGFAAVGETEESGTAVCSKNRNNPPDKRPVDLVTRSVSEDGKEDLAHASGCDSRHYFTSGH